MSLSTRATNSVVGSLVSDAATVGICKVIPPKGWFEREYDINTIPVKISTPVKQCVTGGAGVYEVQLFEVKSMTAADIAKYADKHMFYYEECYETRERKFWRSLGSIGVWGDPIYGADVMGSLFEDKEASGWNLNKLDSILNDIGSVIPGVNCGYLYFGMWKSLFAYHTEDYDLFSVNYVHYGEAKSWYSIPPASRKLFESMAEGYFTNDYRDCKEYLRHKTKMFSPTKLKERGIPFNTVLQQAGEFVVTFPGSYHAGFNHGFNIAEATNFAASTWFDIGRRAKHCVCRPNAVKLDIDNLETVYLRNANSAYQLENNSELAAPILRVRCCCSEKQIVLRKVPTDGTDATVKCCSACRLFYHPKCRNEVLVSIHLQSTVASVDAKGLCNVCALMEMDEVQLTGTTASAASDGCESSDDELEYQEVCVSLYKY
jgi:jumonji domain-containing protein 2